MPSVLRRFLPFVLLISLVSVARAQWQQPAPEELSMTADPAAPGQPAVYLYREESVDDKLHYHSLYARVKILTDKGKAFADVDLPVYEGHEESITNIEGRTIHSDGTIIPFIGKPFDKMVEKTRHHQYKTKVFTMPDVQVGSILEYRYVLRYQDDKVVSPHWYIQQPVFVHKAHYSFLPTEKLVDTGRSGVTSRVAYSRILPAGSEVQYIATRKTYVLDLQNVPAIPDDDYMPPMESFSYRLLFYYTGFQSSEEYWKSEGKVWSKELDRFANPSKVQGALATIVAPSDTPQQKLQKIYAAMMQLDNTSFTRSHSAAENKAEGVKIKTAADIWEQKRGGDDEITLLFVALARAAGFKAYVMAVTDRDRNLFQQAYLHFDQLDDLIAIVSVDGTEKYFDPGQRYCEFGQLHWKHTMAQGIRQTESGTAIAGTPQPNYKQNQLMRVADLAMAPTGEVTGVVRINLTGAKALEWRQRILRSDETEAKKDFEDELQREVPPGIHVKMNHFVGDKTIEGPLMAVVDVTGGMATMTSKRMFLPSNFFESGSKPMFAAEKRENPVDLQYPYQEQDQITIKLPESEAVESLPQKAKFQYQPNAVFGSNYQADPGKVVIARTLVVGNSLYWAKEYPDLRDFFQKVNSKDQEQVILKAAAPASAGSGQ